MEWTKLTFGKYKGKTFPQIIFMDPDWFFWLVQQDNLYGDLAREARIIMGRATCIRLTDASGVDLYAAYIFDTDDRFERLTGVTKAEKTHQPPRTQFTRHLDLRFLRDTKDYAKGEYKRLMRDARGYLFPQGSNLTRRKVDAFFSDRGNFALAGQRRPPAS